MPRDRVSIARPLVSEPFTNYFCTDPDGHLVQVYFDPHAVQSVDAAPTVDGGGQGR
jgi:hypothetical protein